MKIKIGADPEVFLYDNKAREYVSAAGFFPGTKKEPFKVDKGAVQVDGTALEFNIDPAETADEFYQNIRTVVAQMEEMIAAVNKDWSIKYIPVVEFTDKIWTSVSDEAKILGCDPDYNYTGKVNNNPTDALGRSSVRTGSGHIHIGWTEGEDPQNALHFEDCRFVASKLYRGGLLAPVTKEEFQRLSFYGMNGSFRPKSYGVEYRAPSNTWVATKLGIENAFNQTKTMFEKATA